MVFYQLVYHQLLDTVIHIGVGEITAKLLREFIVPLTTDFLHDGIAPLAGHVSEILLHIFRAENPLLAHLDIIFRSFGVPLTRHLESLVRIGERLCRCGHHAKYAAQRGGIFFHLFTLFLGQIGLCISHDGCEVAAEIVAHKTLYLRESFALLYSSIHKQVSLYHIYLLQ